MDRPNRAQLSKWIACYLIMASICMQCSITKEIKNGESAYELKQYAVAVEMLSEEYKKESNDRAAARIAYLLGSSYEILRDHSKAVRWYSKAERDGYGEAATRALAKALKKNAEYEESYRLYRDLQEKHPSDPMIKREVQILELVMDWLKERQQTVKIFELDGNTSRNEYAASIYEGEYLVFTSDRRESTGGDEYPWTGNKYSDLYIADKEGRGARRFDAEINTNANEGAACFNQDFTKIIFTRCYGEENTDAYCKLMYSNKEDGLWNPALPLNFVVDGVNYGQPTLIENDSVLVFCSTGDGSAGYDLFYSQYVGADQWSAPYPMPRSINTDGNEYFPTSYRDTLYFSSDYHPGLGGLDIFSTYLRADGSWAPPTNLKPPINSSHDDFGYIVDLYAPHRSNELEKGFFSTSRGRGGDDNIYGYTRYAPTEVEKDPKTPTEDKGEAIDIFLAGKVITDDYEDEDDPNSTITGAVPVSDARIQISGGLNADRRTDREGLFIEQLEKERSYIIKASAPGYLSQTVVINTNDLNLPLDENSYTINVEIRLEKIFYDQEIVLTDIYYEYDRWDIIEDAKPTLNRLVRILKDNPRIRMQLSSHTDCRGEEDYNAQLSQKRAQSAVLYLVDQGIPFDRLQAQGYGESQLAIDCECDSCTEAQHKANRRTTFAILR